MTQQSRETGSVAFTQVMNLVPNWRIQTQEWPDGKLCGEIYRQTGVRICRATQGELPNQTHWVYAHEPATQQQLLLVALMLR